MVLLGCANDDRPVFEQTDAEQTDTDASGTDAGSDVSNDDAGNTSDVDIQNPQLTELLAQLDADPEGAVKRLAAEHGWPVPLTEGHLFVSLAPGFNQLSGDFNDFAGTPMIVQNGYAYLVQTAVPGTRYKFSNGTEFVSDPWSRAYTYDEFGEMSLVDATEKHLQRFFEVGDDTMAARTLHVLVPAEEPTHVLYAHDGQNLFDPNAIWGGWKLQDVAPAGMMIVGIPNTAARMDEYTHVPDDIDGSGSIGGKGDDYAAFVQETVRPLIRATFGEPAKIGTMGSSLGGLISLHLAHRYPGEFDFAASLSGTLGWGSIGLNNPTMISLYTGQGVRDTYLYIDSGGGASGCLDSDNDGVQDDDPTAADNYCENKQFEALLVAEGYVYDVNLTHWWEPDAPHNEAAWAARVFRPLGIFSNL